MGLSFPPFQDRNRFLREGGLHRDQLTPTVFPGTGKVGGLCGIFFVGHCPYHWPGMRQAGGPRARLQFRAGPNRAGSFPALHCLRIGCNKIGTSKDLTQSPRST